MLQHCFALLLDPISFLARESKEEKQDGRQFIVSLKATGAGEKRKSF